MYTVIPSTSSSPPSCINVTFSSPLQVDAVVANGPLSRYGWIEQVSFVFPLVDQPNRLKYPLVH